MNLQTFDLLETFPSSLLIFIFGFLITYKLSRNFYLSLFTSTIKTIIFSLYFTVYFDGTFTFIDDWKYFNISKSMVNNFDFFRLFDQDFYDKLHYLSKSRHITYYVHNIISMKILGIYYFVPVCFNILLLYIAGYYFFKLLIKLEFKKNHAIFLYLFLIFHFEILSWGSIANLKDILVLLLTILLFYSFYKFEEKEYFSALLLFFAVFIIFSSLRFYIPFLFILSIVIYHILKYSSNLSFFKKIFFLIFTLFTLLILSMVFKESFSYELDILLGGYTNPIFGSIRFLLSPIPFNTEEKYSFLDFPLLISWILYIFTFYGFFLMLKLNNKFLKIFLVYFVIIVLFYGSYEELQGPRHRIQIIFIIIIMTYFGLKKTYLNIYKRI